MKETVAPRNILTESFSSV